MKNKDINSVSNNNGDSEKKPNQEKQGFFSKYYKPIAANSQKVSVKKSQKSESVMIEENDKDVM